MREKESVRVGGGGAKEEREVDHSLLSKETDAGLQPKTLGS